MRMSASRARAAAPRFTSPRTGAFMGAGRRVSHRASSTNCPKRMCRSPKPGAASETSARTTARRASTRWRASARITPPPAGSARRRAKRAATGSRRTAKTIYKTKRSKVSHHPPNVREQGRRSAACRSPSRANSWRSRLARRPLLSATACSIRNSAMAM